MYCLLMLLSRGPLEYCQSYLPFHSLESARRKIKNIHFLSIKKQTDKLEVKSACELSDPSGRSLFQFL